MKTKKETGENPEGNEADFVMIDIPGAKFQMKKQQERDANGSRTSISYTDTIKKLTEMGYRLMNKDELCAMRAYASKKLPEDCQDTKQVEKLFGIEDLGEDEWIYDCDEVAGFRWDGGAYAGPFCADLGYVPGIALYGVGFRCCRDVP